MADISRARAALTKRILEGDGKADRALRKAAFERANVPESARALVDKVASQAAQIGDADIAAVKATGLSEDQVFEVVVCAAIGQATRQYESALAALAAATQGKDR